MLSSSLYVCSLLFSFTTTLPTIYSSVRSESMASVYSQGEGRYGTVVVRGDVEFGIHYRNGALEIAVKQCKDLAAVDIKRNRSDPYLLPGKGLKQKTTICRRTNKPKWEQTISWDDVTLAELSDRSLEITVWDHDRLGHNEMIGGLRFNNGSGKHQHRFVNWMDSSGKEVTLWQQIYSLTNAIVHLECRSSLFLISEEEIENEDPTTGTNEPQIKCLGKVKTKSRFNEKFIEEDIGKTTELSTLVLRNSELIQYKSPNDGTGKPSRIGLGRYFYRAKMHKLWDDEGSGCPKSCNFRRKHHKSSPNGARQSLN
ncbi:SYTL [Lepeophtheirus salmonis]|uniref:SYTL n=1 Tax=Lepeophtheirus salmonis TaxID=72036 RepID=A0A7R8HEB5_LEPSM|nr:SYTL [Lepeophtheirus salmonis]CAF3041550.1 SYTL [Lepeophtheirus salmonis]